MVDLKVEHVLLIVIAVFLLYHLMNRCGCSDGFSVGIEDINVCPTDARNPVDACIAHTTDCDKLYTHTIDSVSPYAVHTCKSGLLTCISSGNKCVFPDDHLCTEGADCKSNECINSETILGKNIKKCGPTPPPPPPPPSCPSGQSYCQSGDGITPNGCYPTCKNGKLLGANCLCLPKCCFTDPDKCPGGPGVCDP